MSNDPLWFAQILIAAIADIAFACALGGAFLSVWLSKENAAAPVSPARLGWVRARRLSTGGGVVLAVADLVLVWMQAASMSGAPLFQAFDAVVTVVTGTHAGMGWAIAFAGSVLLILATSLGNPKGGPRVGLFAIGALVAAAGKASIGHAADAGAFSLAEGVQTVHLLATAVWGGLVIASAWRGVAERVVIEGKRGRARFTRASRLGEGAAAERGRRGRARGGRSCAGVDAGGVDERCASLSSLRCRRHRCDRHARRHGLGDRVRRQRAADPGYGFS